MKQIYLSFCVYFCISNIYSQEFAPIGAKWFYTQHTVNPGYITYESLESKIDTFYEGFHCKKIERVSRDGFDVKSNIFMFKRNDSIFYYHTELKEYCLLYDFSAKQYDTIKLNCFKAYYNGNTKPSPLLVIIDSVKTIKVNDISKKVQYVRSGDGFIIEFGGTNIEDIGNTQYMFPRLDNYMTSPLRCYSFNGNVYKNIFDEQKNWNGECEQIITNSKIWVNQKLKIIPNPIFDSFFIENFNGIAKYQIFNMKGIELNHGKIEANQKIDVAHLNKGIYILRIMIGDRILNYKIVKSDKML